MIFDTVQELPEGAVAITGTSRSDANTSSGSVGSSIRSSEIEEKFGRLESGDRLFLDDLPGASNVSRLDLGEQIFPQEMVALINQGGSMLSPGGGVNTVFGDGGNDLIEIKNEGGVNDITTGSGRDFLHVGDDDGGVNLIRDFDPALDTIGISQEMDLGRLGLSEFDGNALLIDDKGDVMAILEGVAASDISADNVRPMGNVAVRGVKRGIGGEEVADRFGSGGDFGAARFDGDVRTVARGSGDARLIGTDGNDKLTGREGNDFISASPI